jgi:lysozyme family protein
MPLTGKGWELLIVRKEEQRRASDGKIRTVGSYQVHHDGKAVKGPLMSGMVAESAGPGDNGKAGNRKRVEAGTYPLATQDGTKYDTTGYSESVSPRAKPKPGLELLKTGKRSEILIHPGQGFLASVGCLNLCKSLPQADEAIDYAGSRDRVIALIDDLREYVEAFGDERFPKNGKPIPGASVVIEGEPVFGEAVVAPPKPRPKPKAETVPKGTENKFRDAMARVLVHEGGSVDNPKDPGGRTNKGITQRVYSAWRLKNNLKPRDVFDIDDMEVEAIYRFQYWQPIHGEAMPAGVGYVVLDGAVHSGPKQSGKWLQRALGSLYGSSVDGDIGTVTLQAIEAYPDHDQLIADICERRMVFLQALKTWSTFRKGWTARVQDVLAAGQAWASGSVPSDAEYRPGGESKAEVEDAVADPPRAPGDIGTGGGVVTAGGGGLLSQLREQLEQYTDSIGWLGTVVVGLIIAGAVIAGVSFLYRWWAARRKAALDDALDRKEVRT